MGAYAQGNWRRGHFVIAEKNAVMLGIPPTGPIIMSSPVMYMQIEPRLVGMIEDIHRAVCSDPRISQLEAEVARQETGYHARMAATYIATPDPGPMQLSSARWHLAKIAALNPQDSKATPDAI